MDVLEFGDCCTARIIQDWGEDRQTYEEYKRITLPLLAQNCQFLNEDEQFAREPEDQYDDLRNLGIVFATVTSNQRHAIRFAKEVGFRVTKGATKGRHRDTKLVGMFIDSLDLYNWYTSNN